MRIGLCRRGGPAPPPRDILATPIEREPEPADYDAMRVESAALTYVAVERPQGVPLPELARELLITLPSGSENHMVERAVERLVADRLLVIEDGQVLPGPVFGSATSTNHVASNN